MSNAASLPQYIGYRTPNYVKKKNLFKPLDIFFFSTCKITLHKIDLRVIKLGCYFNYSHSYSLAGLLLDKSNFEKTFILLKKRSVHSILFFLYKSFAKGGRLLFVIKTINKSLSTTLNVIFNNFFFAYFLDFFFVNAELSKTSAIFSFKFQNFYYKDIFLIDSSNEKNQLAGLRSNVDVDMYYIGEKIGGLGDTFNSEFFLVLFYKYYNFFFLTKQN